MIAKFNVSAPDQNQVAIVFVHGFTGDLKGTWGQIPKFLAADPQLSGWDLFGFGYQSRRRFDILKLWSADARLEDIATELYSVPELRRYIRLAFVAHSMGGLVVQRAIVKYEDLRNRISHVILFGTPSAGLVKASLLEIFKQQINNMSTSGPFIRDLRRQWSDLGLDRTAPFIFLSIAGETDQFVPPESSLGPFTESVQRVIPGHHLSMLNAPSQDAPCVRMLVEALAGVGAISGSRTSARLAIEKGDFEQVVRDLGQHRDELDDSGAVRLALALDGLGRRIEAIQFLESHSPTGTDVLGVLAGRYKRVWYLERRRMDLDKALDLYGRGYSRATARNPADHDQAYYHGINLAYLKLASGTDPEGAKNLAHAVLDHCEKAANPRDETWRLATKGSALLVLGRLNEAFQAHEQAAKQEMDPWQALSIQEQTLRMADICGLRDSDMERLLGRYKT
jgi:hypothetical protein